MMELSLLARMIILKVTKANLNMFLFLLIINIACMTVHSSKLTVIFHLLAHLKPLFKSIRMKFLLNPLLLTEERKKITSLHHEHKKGINNLLKYVSEHSKIKRRAIKNNSKNTAPPNPDSSIIFLFSDGLSGSFFSRIDAGRGNIGPGVGAGRLL